MSRHHAHTGDHLVMAVGVVISVVGAAVCWAGLVRLLGGGA